MAIKRIAFQTFGCKLNFAESSTLARQFKEDGYEVVDHKEDADIYIINSCVVTSNAEKKCRAAIRQARKRNCEATIAIVGCFSQMAHESLSRMDEIDLILGTDEKFQLKNYLKGKNHEGSCFSRVGDISRSSEFIPSWSSGDRTRSFLKIQDGCDYFCTFCTIPFARGRSRSASIQDTLSTAREVASSGMREIILTGVNIGDFGKPNGENFFDLMKKLDTLEGIDRIRISSIEPELLNEDMIEYIHTSRKFLPHFHIPLQSGSDHVLKMMKRKYKREIFAKRVEEIKKHMPHACIAADVIIGFPGESDTHFEDTFSFLESLDVAYMHVFTYSERPGTRAVEFADKVPSKIKRERSRRLHELSDRKKKAFYEQNIGSSRKVLFESDNTNGYMHGFTGNYLKVKTPFKKEFINQIVEVKLDKLDTDGNFLYIPDE